MDISEPLARQGFLTWGVHCSGGAHVSSLTSALTQHTRQPPTTAPPQSAPALVTNSYVRWPTDCAGGNIQKQVRARGEKKSLSWSPRTTLPKRDKPLPRPVTGNHRVRDSATMEGPPKPAPLPKPRPRNCGGGAGLDSPRKAGAAVEAWRVFPLPVGGLRSSWEGNRQQGSAAELTPGSRHRASGNRGAASASLTDPQAAAAAPSTTGSHFSDALSPASRALLGDGAQLSSPDLRRAGCASSEDLRGLGPGGHPRGKGGGEGQRGPCARGGSRGLAWHVLRV